MKITLRVGAAVTPYSGPVTRPSPAVKLVDGGRARTTATARSPNKEPNVSPGDAFSSLGPRLKRLKPILEAGRLDPSAAVRDHEYDLRDHTPDQRGSYGKAILWKAERVDDAHEIDLKIVASSAVLPSPLSVHFQAVSWRHSVVPNRNHSQRFGMAGRGSGDTIIRFGWHVQRLRQRESSSHGQVSGLSITVMMQSHGFRRGLAPGALRRDHCQHGMVRTAADRPRRPRLIWTPGLSRNAGNFATQIDS